MAKNDVEVIVALSTKQFTNGVKQLSDSYKKTATSVSKSSKKIGDSFDQVEKGVVGTNKALKDTSKKVFGANFALKKIKRNADGSVDSFARFEKKLKATEKALKKATTGIQRGTKSLKNTTKQTKAASSVFSTLAKNVAVAAVAFVSIRAIMRSFTATLTVAAEFEKRMSAVGAVMGATASEMDRMAKAASHMGETTKFTALQSAEALEFLGMAGLSASQAIKALPGTLELAAAGSMDLATAADLATNVLSGMGKDVSELGRVNDVLAYAASKANTSVTELGGALKVAGPIAAAVGMSLEQTVSILAEFANRGVKAESAGEKFKQMIAKLINPVAEAQAAMDKLNVSLRRSADGSVDLIGTLQDFHKAGMTASQAAEIFGQRTFGSGLLAAAASGDMAKFADAITGVGNAAEGAGKRMADAKLDNIAGDVTILGSAVEGLGKAFGGIITGSAESRELVQDLTKSVGELTDFVKDNQDAISAFFLEPIMAIKNNIGFVIDFYNAIGKARTSFTEYAFGSSLAAQGTKDFAGTLFDLTPTLDNLYSKIELLTLGTVKNWRTTYKEVEKQGEAYKYVAESMEVLRNTQQGLKDAGLEESKIAAVTLRLRELGAAYAKAGGDPAKFAEQAAKIQDQANLEIKEAEKVRDKKVSFETQIHNKKKEITNLNIQLEDLLADQTLSILSATSDRIKRFSDEQLQKKIANGNKELNALRTQLEKSVAEQQKYANKVKDLESQRAIKTQSIEDQIRNIKRKGLSEAAQQADILKQINEKILKSEEARVLGETEASRRLLESAESLTGRIAEGEKQASVLKRLKTKFEELSDVEISAAQRAESAEKKKAEVLKEQIVAVDEQIKTLKQEQVIRIKTNLEEVQGEIGKIEGYIKELIKPRTVKINVEKVEKNRLGGPIGFNSGGKLSGYGGGDRVSALLEAGEYVIRKEAVRKYGAGLFHALNNMNFGKMFSGAHASLGAMPRLKFATGGQVPGSDSPRITEVIRLELGGKHIDVSSPKNIINEFLEAVEQGGRGMA